MTTYEIRVIGSLSLAAREAFAGLAVEVEPAITVLSGDLDQCGLHALLDRARWVLNSWPSDRFRRRHDSRHIPLSGSARAVVQSAQLHEFRSFPAPGRW